MTDLNLLAKELCDFYEGRKLTGEKAKYEPKWMHPMYDQFRAYLTGTLPEFLWR